MFRGYTFMPESVRPIIGAALEWMWIELTEGWRTWFQKREAMQMETAMNPKVAMEKAGAGS